MKEHVKNCGVCSNDELECVLDLPNLPLTGIYIDVNQDDTYPLINQALMMCNKCGHMQLKYMVDPQYLYQDTYTHRSGESPISKSGNDFFIEFLKNNNKQNKIDSLFEIGCNDLYLLSQLKDSASELVGVDPIWEEKVSLKEGITVLGGFAEDVDYENVFKKKPDFVISSHTFEHIQDVHKVLESVLNNLEEGSKFLIEIPCADTMLKICRFDQVFHQHFNYFSLHSFFNFIQLHGCEFLEYTMNYNYWGGTMLISFKKGGNYNQENPFKKFTSLDVIKRFEIFQNDLKNVQRLVSVMDEDIYGFGAAQMLPILAYHMDNLPFIKAIIDDNPERCGRKLVGLDIPIVSSDSIKNLQNSVVMITALDSTKTILSRLNKDFNPRYIIRPIQIT